MTHPVQYFAPWFRHIASNCPEIDLNVLYAIRPTPEQQGVGFGKAFEWDRPLTEGYRSQFIRKTTAKDNLNSETFLGLNVPEVKQAIHESRPDVVLILGWHSVTQVRALWVCRKMRIPVIYRGDTHLGNSPGGWRHPVWKGKTRTLLRFFDAYLSVGKRTRQYLLEMGVSTERIFDSPHCVDNEYFALAASRYQTPLGRQEAQKSFDIQSDDFVILFVGKLEAKKRPLDLIRAASHLSPGVALLMVGSGPLEGDCRVEAEKLNVRIHWAGFLNQSELGRAYAAADCLVLPSDWGETWGLVVNEAMATGLPCIVSDRVGCAPDLIEAGSTGEVFPMGNVNLLSQALTNIRRKSKSNHDFLSACRKRAASYSIPVATAGLLNSCRFLLGEEEKIKRSAA